jgi:hypothetical protein
MKCDFWNNVNTNLAGGDFDFMAHGWDKSESESSFDPPAQGVWPTIGEKKSVHADSC